MNAHDLIRLEHTHLRNRFHTLQKALDENFQYFLAEYNVWHQELCLHFRREDSIYYPAFDPLETEQDRDLLHSLRNDHAALIFALESLHIKLRKETPRSVWDAKWQMMTNLLLEHFNREEKNLFTIAEKKFDSQKLTDLGQAMEAIRP